MEEALSQVVVNELPRVFFLGCLEAIAVAIDGFSRHKY